MILADLKTIKERFKGKKYDEYEAPKDWGKKKYNPNNKKEE